jgi:hypothetical protein
MTCWPRAVRTTWLAAKLRSAKPRCDITLQLRRAFSDAATLKSRLYFLRSELHGFQHSTLMPEPNDLNDELILISQLNHSASKSYRIELAPAKIHRQSTDAIWHDA